MTVDWSHFTPWLSLGGGILIGLAAALFILGLGRIAGISGIVGCLLEGRHNPHTGWRAAFVAGMVASPLIFNLFARLPAARIDTGWPLLIVAGLLVGFGSRLGSGCTSGHGVCGLSRLSPRSVVATLSFMLTGFVTATLIHLL